MANNNIIQPLRLTANVSSKTITLSVSYTVEDKWYDGATTATIKNSNLVFNGLLNPDVLSLSTLVLNFSQSDIANDITVTITAAELAGDDAQNYILSLDGVPTTTANILDHTGVNLDNECALAVYQNPCSNQMTLMQKPK
jgi:hypothetical protein